MGRSDFGSYVPILRCIRERNLGMRLLVSGAHLSPEFGHTVDAIEASGFEIAARIPMLVPSDTPDAIARSIGLGVIGFAQSYAEHRPDLILVLGDRFEMYAAALAALPFAVPIAHIHGGEVTEGAIDDALRHSMTKLSHLHFVATAEYAARVRQLGEEAWRVTIAGAPVLDNLRTMTLLSPSELAERFRIRVEPPPLLVTFHPTTLEFEHVEHQTLELLGALADVGRPIVFTLPNADTNGGIIIRLVHEFVARHGPMAQLVENFGTEGYFSMMKIAPAMVGNSSSGLIEASSFGIPVVNVGNRQRGRVRGENVIDVSNDRESIVAGIEKACSAAFREHARGARNPYAGGGSAAGVIVEKLATVPLDQRLVMKKFCDQRPA